MQVIGFFETFKNCDIMVMSLLLYVEETAFQMSFDTEYVDYFSNFKVMRIFFRQN